jgi:hypothetical protein
MVSPQITDDMPFCDRSAFAIQALSQRAARLLSATLPEDPNLCGSTATMGRTCTRPLIRIIDMSGMKQTVLNGTADDRVRDVGPLDSTDCRRIGLCL